MSDFKIKASVFIVTLNEEANIGRVLASCKEFDEIIVVDSGSTDETLTIAKNFNVKIVHNDWPGYAAQKEYAMSLCSNEWVLNLDADEELTPELKIKFKEIMDDGKYDSVRCQRKDYFMGSFFSELTKKQNNCRFYKKDVATFDQSRLAHERADISGNQIFVKEAFNHYGYSDIESITTKNNIYSSLKAKEKFLKGKKGSFLKLLISFPAFFIKTYLLQRYLFSGYRGFIISILTAYYMFIKEAKLIQYRENNNE